MSDFKKMVAGYVQPLLDSGATGRQVAADLGLPQPNYLYMILSDRYPEAQLPLQRIPALVSLCGLTARQALALVKLKLRSSKGGQRVVLDEDTFNWLIRCTALGLKEVRGSKTA